jgi:hypothetical protein
MPGYPRDGLPVIGWVPEGRIRLLQGVHPQTHVPVRKVLTLVGKDVPSKTCNQNVQSFQEDIPGLFNTNVVRYKLEG